MECWAKKIIEIHMKVTGVKTYVIENESAPRSGGGQETGNWYIGGKYFLILELSTDEGIIGLGEKLTGSSFTGNMTWKDFKSQILLVHETVEAFVVGKNPFEIEKISEVLLNNEVEAVIISNTSNATREKLKDIQKHQKTSKHLSAYLDVGNSKCSQQMLRSYLYLK